MDIFLSKIFAFDLDDIFQPKNWVRIHIFLEFVMMDIFPSQFSDSVRTNQTNRPTGSTLP